MTPKLKKAIEIATKYHEGQFRKDGRPYIVHPMAVMELLKEHDFPEDALIAAVLHDVCEDTSMTNVDMANIFGNRVGFIVNALTKNRKPKDIEKLRGEFKNKKNSNNDIKNYRNLNEYIDYRFHLYINRFHIGIMAEPWILFIKISDQVNNLGDMNNFKKEKKIKKINEIEKYFLPIYIKSEKYFKKGSTSLKDYYIFLKIIKNSIKKAKTN